MGIAIRTGGTGMRSGVMGLRTCGGRMSDSGRIREAARSAGRLGNWSSRHGRHGSEILMNSDFKDLLHLFAAHEVRYLVVGGYAAMQYSQPRLTKDLDLWLEPSIENAARVLQAFAEFGMPLIDVDRSDFEKEGLQYMVGRSPVVFDFPTSVPGLDFDPCWKSRAIDKEEGVPISYLSKEALIRAKEHAGQPVDRQDIDETRRAEQDPNS